MPNYPDTLEPLFRFSNREVQGTKFMDMLGRYLLNPKPFMLGRYLLPKP